MTATERAAQALEATGLGRALPRLGSWRGVLVLNYHRIGDARTAPGDRGVFSASPEQLDAQLGVLAQRADVVGPQDVLVDPDRRGRRVVLTFDDGYRDNHERALPLLRRHGLTATFFVVSGFLGQIRAAWWDEVAWMVRSSRVDRLDAGEQLQAPIVLDAEDGREAAIASLLGRLKTLPPAAWDRFLTWLGEATGSGRCLAPEVADAWMTWDMVRDLVDAGMQVGGHTVTHPVLAALPRDRQRAELRGCAEDLRAHLGLPMRWLSYPVGLPGSFDATTRAAAREAGVELAFGFSGGYLRPGRLDPLDVPRTAVSQSMSAARFAAMLSAPQVFARW